MDFNCWTVANVSAQSADKHRPLCRDFWRRDWCQVDFCQFLSAFEGNKVSQWSIDADCMSDVTEKPPLFMSRIPVKKQSSLVWVISKMSSWVGLRSASSFSLKLATDGRWAPRSSPRFQESPAYFLFRTALFSCYSPPIRGDECEIERTNMFVLITVGNHSLFSSKDAFIMKGWQSMKLLLILAFLSGDIQLYTGHTLYIIQGIQWCTIQGSCSVIHYTGYAVMHYTG